MIPAPMPSPTPSSPQYTIVFKYVPGDDLQYQSTITASGSCRIKSQPFSAKLTIASVGDQIVKSVDSYGNGTLTGKVDSLNVSVIINGKSVSIPITPADIKSTANVGSVTMSPRGTYISSDPGKAIPASESQELSLGNAVISSLTSQLAILPDHPVAVLDTWRGGLAFAPVGLAISMKMTLNSVKVVNGHNIADIGVKLFVTLAPNLDKYHDDTPDIKVQLSGLGDVDFDIDDGYAQSYAFDMTALLKLKPRLHKHHHRDDSGDNEMPQSGTLTCHIDSALQGVTYVGVTYANPAPTPQATPAPTPQITPNAPGAAQLL
jgi:hypothetical protein